MNPTPHRAQFWKRFSKKPEEVFLMMVVCDAWTKGFLDGTLNEKDPNYVIGINGE